MVTLVLFQQKSPLQPPPPGPDSYPLEYRELIMGEKHMHHANLLHELETQGKYLFLKYIGSYLKELHFSKHKNIAYSCSQRNLQKELAETRNNFSFPIS